MTKPTENPAKRQEREELERLTKEFLERGGQVVVLPSGVMKESVTLTDRQKERVGK